MKTTETLSSKLESQFMHDCVLFKNNSIAAIGLRVRWYCYYTCVHDAINMRAGYVEHLQANKSLQS
jgi:hypothetical protein